MKKLNIVFCSFPDYSSNAKALYEYMITKYKNDFNLIWAVNSDKMVEILSNKGIETYKIGSNEYYNRIKNIDVFFTTHANITDEKNDNALYIELWHGIGGKSSGYMVNNLSSEDFKWYSEIRKKIDYMIVPSDFWRPIFSTIFNMQYNRVVPLGYPKLDPIINSRGKENLNKILNFNTNKFNKVIFYMPTFRSGCNRNQETTINQKNILNIEEYDEYKLLNFLKENNYLLCIKKHPSEENELNFIENNNVKVLKESDFENNGLTINEILNAADILITDYSSLGIDFLILNKPVIYINNDVDQYKKNRGIIFSNTDFWMPGYKSKTITELIDNIEEANKYGIHCDQLKMKNIWFGGLENGGCEQICNFIFDKNGINKKIKYYKDIEDILNQKLENDKILMKEKDDIIDARNARIRELDAFISEIINSKGWQTLEKLRNIKKKILRK